MSEGSPWLGMTAGSPSGGEGRWHRSPPDFPISAHRGRLLVTIVLIATGLLVVLLVAIPFVVPHQTLPMAIIVFISVFTVIAALVAGIAGAYLFLTRDSSVAPAPGPSPSESVGVAPPASDRAPLSDRELEHLVLRVLEGDERQLMAALLTGRGDVLQKELVKATSFSEAKVSRLLDRLAARGLVVRERQGMSNRVRATLRRA